MKLALALVAFPLLLWVLREGAERWALSPESRARLRAACRR